MTKASYSLQEICLYFLKLGAIGFGGPVALVGNMHKDLVENRKWISEEEYKQGLALAQLAPGPLAAQLGIYLGFVHYGILGATICGIAFVLPSFFMVVLLGYFYQIFGGLIWMKAVFYGVGAAVIGIIAFSSYKLSIKSISDFRFSSIKKKWILWLIYLIAALVTIKTQTENVFLFIVTGFVYMLLKSPPAWIKRRKSVPVLLLGISGFLQFEWHILTQIFWFFAKAGAFVFGSGLAIVPFLHAGLVTEHHWITEQQFIDAVAVAMITPGPVVITVGFIGYLMAGLPGAFMAALAVFLPCYLFTILLAPYFKKIAENESIKSFVQGITAAVVGALVGAVVVMAQRNIVDIPTVIIAAIVLLLIIYIKKINEPSIILLAAIAGLILKGIS